MFGSTSFLACSGFGICRYRIVRIPAFASIASLWASFIALPLWVLSKWSGDECSLFNTHQVCIFSSFHRGSFPVLGCSRLLFSQFRLFPKFCAEAWYRPWLVHQSTCFGFCVFDLPNFHGLAEGLFQRWVSCHF